MMYGYIYVTTNLVNNKKYIGQHKSKIFDNNYLGSGVLLQKAIKKYGKENFSCCIIEEANSEEELNALENHYVNIYNAIDDENFYNLCEGGIGNWNYVNSHREEYNVGMIGKHHTEETKKKISQSKTGNVHHTEETKQKLREISSRYRHTDEAKRKIGDAHRGMKFSDEAKKHISEGLKGRKLSEETKRKISEGGKGKKHKKMSAESRKHISDAKKAYWARVKNGTDTNN